MLDKNHHRTWSIFLIWLGLGFGAIAFAEKSAPSSHFVFDDDFAGDIIVNQVRVPKHGKAMYTYYEALGWRGKAAGYAGIQAHPKGHNFIFSIWDHKEHKGRIKAVHKGPGTKTEKFGGEGTGLKSWNFELGWKTDVWYTLVSRCWDVGEHTYFGFWSRAGDTGVWTHLVTMDVSVAHAKFRGRTDAFIEDWLNTGKQARTTQLRGGWKRKENGEWYPFQGGRYSVNAWDLEKGKRSYQYRSSWDGGVETNGKEQFYFMAAGGKDTKPRVDNPSVHKIKRDAKHPELGPPAKAKQAKARRTPDGIVVTWQVDSKATPQFAVDWSVKSADGDELASGKSVTAHARKLELKVDSAGAASVVLGASDVLGRKEVTTIMVE